MGRGSSKAGGGGGKTPSGVTYDQFMKMSDDEKYDTIAGILGNQNINVPTYLDSSDTTKVLYALGANQKTTVVSDQQLDSMQGMEIFRTVYEGASMPPPSSDAILDQIRNDDFTCMSDKGGSVHGRALYFATDYTSSASYGHYEKNAMVMRAKINSNAKILRETNLANQMRNDTSFMGKMNGKLNNSDMKSLWALSHGIDGWYSGNYTMIVNRGALTASSQNKTVNNSNGGYARSWSTATKA